MLKIAIIHYHLLPGGVTRIIGSQVKALRDPEQPPEISIWCGPEGGEEVPGAVLHRTDLLAYHRYDNPDRLLRDSGALVQLLREACGQGILHFHNPGLGKNPALSLAVNRLAIEGLRMVNHCHDFPEDRPENYAVLTEAARAGGMSVPELLYPDRSNCHYAVLNGCDYRRMAGWGLTAGRLHLLPNPVALTGMERRPGLEQRTQLCHTLGLDPDRRLVTYPVRAIGRKNMGELILLAILFRTSTSMIVTQPPKNPAEFPAYLHWKDWCVRHGIHITFEAGEKINHEELTGISEFCITTSVREGFGMVFLEPWLAGTPVIGRNLPCVTGDLRENGMELPGLYDALLVDGPEGVTDFGTLEDDRRQLVLERLLKDPEAEKRIFALNPFLDHLFDSQEHVIEKNRTCIRQHYSLAQYGEQLSAIYKALS